MKPFHTAMIAAISTALAGFSAQAQTQTPPASTQPPPAAQGSAQPSANNQQQGQSSLEQADQTFLENAIQGSYAEIEGSKLALEKAESQDVKDFARMMVKDHEKMAKEAAALATEKGLTPPDGPSAMQTTEITALKALSGGAFDAMYVNRIGVASHEATVEMFEKASKEAQDPDVKALATKALPKLREHLEMARTLNEKQEK